MKKMIVAAVMAALTMTCFAQDYTATLNSVTVEANYKYISPLSLSTTEFNLQALKDSAVNDQDYAAALTFLQTRLKDEKEVISRNQKTLKTEKSLYDAQMSLYKDRKSEVADIQKQMDNNIKKYKGYINDLEKQQDLIKKIENNTCDAIKSHSKDIDQQKRHFNESIDRFESMKKNILEQSTEGLNQEFTKLNDFLIEVTDKETRLTSMANQNKTNLEIVGAQLKATEALIKAAAKAAKGKK